MLKHLLMLYWGKLVKMEAHKSSGIRELTKCLCDVFGRRAMVCRPVFSRYPSWAVLAAGGQGMALTSPGPAMSRALGSPWHRQPQVAPQPGAISLFLSPCSCVCWDSPARWGPATSHPPCWSQQILRLPTSAPLMGCRWPRAHSPLLCSWWQKWHHEGCVPRYWTWAESCLFPPLALTSSHKRQGSRSSSTSFINRLQVPDRSWPQAAWKKKDGSNRRKAALHSSHTDWCQEPASISKESCFHKQLNLSFRAFRSA